MTEEETEGVEGFEKLEDAKQLKIIEEVVDSDIRPMLAMDGGNLEIIDMQKGDEYIDIYIRYLGNCTDCAMGTTGTLFGIEGALRKKVYPKLRILPV